MIVPQTHSPDPKATRSERWLGVIRWLEEYRMAYPPTDLANAIEASLIYAHDMLGAANRPPTWASADGCRVVEFFWDLDSYGYVVAVVSGRRGIRHELVDGGVMLWESVWQMPDDE